MAKTTITFTDYCNTDALFRTNGSTISAAIQAVGLTKVSATGQIDWNTVARPTTPNTVAGFEVFAFNDALQGASPCYLKVRYGTCNDANGNSYQVWLDWGFSHDGAGGIGAGNGMVMAFSGGWDTNARTWYFAGDGSGIVIHPQRGCNSLWWNTVTVERTRSSSGALDARGIVAGRFSADTANYNWSVFTPRGASGTTYVGTSCSPPNSGNSADGNTTYLFPVRPFAKAEQPPFALLAGYFQNDLPDRNPVSITRWDGATKTFMPINDTRGVGSPGYSPAQNTLCAILWE